MQRSMHWLRFNFSPIELSRSSHVHKFRHTGLSIMRDKENIFSETTYEIFTHLDVNNKTSMSQDFNHDCCVKCDSGLFCK